MDCVKVNVQARVLPARTTMFSISTLEQLSGSTPSVFAAHGGAVMSKSRTTTSRDA